LHERPQKPQLAAVVYETQAPWQMLYPGLQTKAHVPDAQTRDAFCSAGHACPQLPQLSGSSAVLVHPSDPEELPEDVTSITAPDELALVDPLEPEDPELLEAPEEASDPLASSSVASAPPSLSETSPKPHRLAHPTAQVAEMANQTKGRALTRSLAAPPSPGPPRATRTGLHPLVP
jgi:hypothetical protein